MWAWRSSSLCRPRALLSQLHPIRRRVAQGAASSRGHASDAGDGDRRDGGAANKPARNRDRRTPETNRPQLCAALRPPPTGQKKHLYLVLDDTKNGVRIHKLDIDGDNDDDDEVTGDPHDDVADDVATDDLERLPEPPVMRMELPLGDNPHVAILGSNVVAMGSGFCSYFTPGVSGGVTVAFDTSSPSLTVLRDLPSGLREYRAHLAVAVRNKLYVIEDGSDTSYDEFTRGGIHCLKIEDDAHGGGKGEKPSTTNGERWSWCDSDFDDPVRWCWCMDPGSLPFDACEITSHALHPGGRVFFVTAVFPLRYWNADGRRRGTFSYDTERGEWTRHGDRELPFSGRAHYDGAMGAWVGLHLHLGAEDFTADGYLCSCDVPPLDDDPCPETPPEWKLS
ncbi:hypothetical protein ACP70R_005090 [Stipagrostis hirtigluma subsp. patula]